MVWKGSPTIIYPYRQHQELGKTSIRKYIAHIISPTLASAYFI